ncbi:MAG: hypothetical protein KDA37_09615 [Planctomycetales bacterium]|nr:hypothetical protein [Planctomycetales bacterium]
MEKYQQLEEALAAGKPVDELLAEVQDAAEEADLEFLRDEIPTAIEQSIEGSERVAKIVRAMKEFSHPGTEEKTNVDINHELESTLTVSRNEWKYVAELVTDFDLALPQIPCFVGEFNQALLNLIVNAAHAMKFRQEAENSTQRGTLTVSTRQVDEFVEIRVADTGTGIPESARSKIFDPFFTTKPVGKGTGQGLAITYNLIVVKHHGKLDVVNLPIKGCKFSASFPCRRPAEGSEELDFHVPETGDSDLEAKTTLQNTEVLPR